MAGLYVTIDTAYWNRAATDLKNYDAALYRAMRKRIRNAGNIAVDKIRETLAMPSPDGGDNSGEGRAALAAGTRTSLSFSAKRAGVKITTTASRLPAEHKGLLNVYNKASFRHPVYGTDKWVEQNGRPYFGKVIAKALNHEILAEMQAAIDDSLAAVADRA